MELLVYFSRISQLLNFIWMLVNAVLIILVIVNKPDDELFKSFFNSTQVVKSIKGEKRIEYIIWILIVSQIILGSYLYNIN